MREIFPKLGKWLSPKINEKKVRYSISSLKLWKDRKRRISKEKLFEELGLESLQHRWWYRKLCCFYKILKDQSPKYLFNIIPKLNRPYSTRNANNILIFLISKLNVASSKILSLRQSSLNGINWTLKFKMLLAIIFSKRIF